MIPPGMNPSFALLLRVTPAAMAGNKPRAVQCPAVAVPLPCPSTLLPWLLLFLLLLPPPVQVQGTAQRPALAAKLKHLGGVAIQT